MTVTAKVSERPANLVAERLLGPMAAGYSLVDFFVLTAPLWLLGLAAVWQTGMSFSPLRKAALGYPKSP